MLVFLWRATKGYRLRPWRSPYLRWRIETWWGIPAETIGFSEFSRFLWAHWRDLWRFLKWSARMRKSRAMAGGFKTSASLPH
jgi:hypothetical protein